MSFRPRRAIGLALDAEKSICVEPQHAGAEDIEGVQRVADDELRRRKRRIKPVEGWLPFFEVVEIYPPSSDPVGTSDYIGGAPVGLLHAWFEEDYAAQLPHDITFLFQLIDCRRRKVDCFAPWGYRRKKAPVGLRDGDHVINARIFSIAEFGESIVGALSGMRGNDVVHDYRGVGRRRQTNRHEVFFGSARRLDFESDAIEVPINCGRVILAADTAGALHRPVVDALDSDGRQGCPEVRIREGPENRLARA